MSDHLVNYSSLDCEVTCPECGKTYHQTQEDQVPGFRDRSEDICPYCSAVNGSSMEIEYFNRRIEK